ncbi:MAG: hypothetical protein AB9842_04345 [Bacteroidales bacterium]
MKTEKRKSSQYILPAVKPDPPDQVYDIYPSFPLISGTIELGYHTLALQCLEYKYVIIDGYGGVFWEEVREKLEEQFQRLGTRVQFFDFSATLRDADEIEAILAPFLGGDDPLFGTRTSLLLLDFFDPVKIRRGLPGKNSVLTIVYGCGSFLSGLDGLKVYLDLPKNEIQYRSRAGRVVNLGCSGPSEPGQMYKRFYFVDWIVLNRHKQVFLHDIDIFGDVQRPGEISWAKGKDIRDTLSAMSRNVFRVRPWFEPGVWGGSWIKAHVPGVNTGVPNYAWSFELIVTENGLLFEQDNNLLELSFDWLMYQNAQHVLGDCYPQFGTEFPIRFDFLDTFDGGNLSVQCHPRPEYSKDHFGENFTQEESYYILDTKDKAQVYLGFQEDIDKGTFRSALVQSFASSNPLDIDQFVQKHTASKHDLFLIPYGTIHGSGRNNLVLEISTTPYIFTFKLYDWVRPDLNGKPRPLNIERGMENLYFNRKGDTVGKELISKPILLKKGENWEHWHLPTHPGHSYDVHRYCFSGSISIENQGKCHVLNLVEGSFIEIRTFHGMIQQFHYAETFVVPAAAQSYTLINRGGSAAMVVLAFMK